VAAIAEMPAGFFGTAFRIVFYTPYTLKLNLGVQEHDFHQ
jgi:hypothetical protein